MQVFTRCVLLQGRGDAAGGTEYRPLAAGHADAIRTAHPDASSDRSVSPHQCGMSQAHVRHLHVDI